MSLTKKDLEDLVKKHQTDLATVNSKLSTLSDLADSIEEMKRLLTASKEENEKLKKHLLERDQEILELRGQLNNVEQHNRAWSVRVMGLPLTADEERSSKLVKRKLFDTLLRPILEGAVREGDLDEVPLNAENLLEMAHALPAKEGAVKPIIARFHAREMRSLVFRHKKRFAPKYEAGPQKDRFKYLIFEDLTRLNFNKMRALAADPRVAAAWSANGQIRYRIGDDPTIRRVRNVLESVEKILA
jgi:hypothetical protein